MAIIYAKSVTDKTLILDPREYLLRPFDLGLWSEIRMGIYWTMVTSAGDDVDAANEVVALNTAADWPCFGIKDSATAALPGQAGALFLGALGWATGNLDTRISGAPSDRIGGSGFLTYALAGYNNAVLKGATTDIALFPEGWSFGQASLAAAYNGFMGVKFVLADRGLATQNVTMTQASNPAVPGADYSVNALRTSINNEVYANNSGVPAVQWNDGIAAYTVPDAFFIRVPFFNARIRISAMQIIRYA